MFISQEHKVKVLLLKISFGYGLHLQNQHVQDANV